MANASVAAPHRDKGNQQQNRRAELIQIAGRLFAERGFLGTTIRNVADAAGIQSGSLYHHFASKEAMVEQLLLDYWNTLIERYQSAIAEELDPAETARLLIRESVRLLDECRYALRILLTDWGHLNRVFPFMAESLGEVQQIWIEVLKLGQESGVFHRDLDPYITYRTIMASISGTTRWFDPRGAISADALADQISMLFMSGINARH